MFLLWPDFRILIPQAMGKSIIFLVPSGRVSLELLGNGSSLAVRTRLGHSVDRFSKHRTRADACGVGAIDVIHLLAEETIGSFFHRNL